MKHLEAKFDIRTEINLLIKKYPMKRVTILLSVVMTVLFASNLLFANQSDEVGKENIASLEAKIAAAAAPLDLTSFEATLDAQGVVLKWSTENEDQFSRFEIEKSIDLDSWKMIGEVDGSGKPFPTEYSFLDPAVEPGTVYYRLRMIDIDQSIMYSEIVALEVEEIEECQISIFPNPADEQINVNISSPECMGSGGSADISNMRGHTLLGQKISGSDGVISMDVSLLPTGTYLLTITVGKEAYQAYFFKQ